MFLESAMCMQDRACVQRPQEIGVWNDSQTMWDSFQTLTLMQKTCLICISGIRYVCARSCLRAQADSCGLRIARVSLVLLFQK